MEERRRNPMSQIDELIQELCPDGVEYIGLLDAFSIKNGRRDRKDAVADGAYKFFTRSVTPIWIDGYSFDGEAIVCPGEGNIGSIHYVNERFDAHQRTYVLQSKIPNVNTKYVFYYMTANWGL